jgi:hypothetical protein
MKSSTARVGEQGHWARRALGTTAGVGISAVGGIGAGLVGVQDAAFGGGASLFD